MPEFQRGQRGLRGFLLAALFAALTAIGAWIKIPLPPVPITLQVLFVVLSGNLLGPRWGAGSQLLYLALGLMGLPLFAGGGGPGYVLAPTFGYLLGFPVAAALCGMLFQWARGSWPKIILGNTLSLIPIYVLGVTYLVLLSRVYLPFSKVLISGFLLFVPGDLLKILLASFIARRLHQVLVGK